MAHAQTRAKVTKAAKGKSKKGGKGKERGERKRPPSLMVNAGTARRGNTRSRTAER